MTRKNELDVFQFIFNLSSTYLQPIYAHEYMAKLIFA